MANPEELGMLKRGVEVWNAWRREQGWNGWRRHLGAAETNVGTKLAQVDLSGADLVAAELYGADFYQVNLRGAALRGARLTEADLRGADLSGADLRAALLVDVSLQLANLENADLRESDLQGANLNGAGLNGTDMSDAVLVNTSLGNLDLSIAKGLDRVRHDGPSSLGIDTIYRSKGAIPEVFLRGAGVPETFITYAKSLVGSAIEFYSCFISYSTQDQAFASRLYADLQAHGVRCWFAPHDVQSGKKLHEQIDEAIRLHDKLLLILSASSMASEWVKTEISKARRLEIRNQARVLFPISLAPFEAIRDWEYFDADAGKDSAREIREYFIPDFSKWKDHDFYREAFERLLDDLKAPVQARP